MVGTSMHRILKGGSTALLAVGLSATPAGAQGASTAAAKPAAAQPSKALGSISAPITMEVFSDFQCPSCRELYQNTLRAVIANYVLPGKVYLVHRDMPLAMHPYAREAARYANAAAHVGKFEQVVDVLYATQAAWSASGKIEEAVAAALTPKEMQRVRKLVKSGKVDAAIDKDVSIGQMFQVRSTPTVIITHKGQTTPLPPGGVNYSLLKQYLDHLLRQ